MVLKKEISTGIMGHLAGNVQCDMKLCLSTLTTSMIYHSYFLRSCKKTLLFPIYSDSMIRIKSHCVEILSKISACRYHSVVLNKLIKT